MDSTALNQSIGKTRTVEERMAANPAQRMQATLNRQPTLQIGDELPPAWHWLYFHEPTRSDALADEGHPELGGFMPPIQFADNQAPPRRMWAGGSFTFDRPIQIGDCASKHSTVKSITPKEGKSGKLLFVVVEHLVSVGGERCLREEQTIVYREPVRVGAGNVHAMAAPSDEEFSARYVPDPILLFRYSALTFNAHRIHYDLDYCRQVEGYPGLVVHGPLAATLLLDLYYQRLQERRIAAFSYRARSPLFVPNEFSVNGKADGQAWAASHKSGLAMTAKVTFSEGQER